MLEQVPLDEMMCTQDIDADDHHGAAMLEYLKEHSYVSTKEFEDRLLSKRAKRDMTSIEAALSAE